MHLGTAIALFIFFWRDWLNFGLSLARPVRARASAADRRVFWLVVLATIPAVLVGSVFRKLLGDAFATPSIAAVFLIVNGFLLYFGDRIGGEIRSAGSTSSTGRARWRSASRSASP